MGLGINYLINRGGEGAFLVTLLLMGHASMGVEDGALFKHL